MAKDLTSVTLERLKPGVSRLEIPDGKCRGMFFILQPTGHRSWAVRYRVQSGANRKLTLGSYPAIDLTNARRLAAKALALVAEGGDPAADKSAAKLAARKPTRRDMVEQVVEQFIERHAKKNTRAISWKESQRLLTVEVVKKWQGRGIGEIGRADVLDVLDSIVDRGAPIMANRALAVIAKMFSWAVERGIVEKSPCAGIKPPSPMRSRDRILDDRELRLIWAASEDAGWPFGPIVQLLMLTGQRREEVAGLRWSELGDLRDKTWSLPRGRSKNDKGHLVPLSSQAILIVENLPHIESRPGLLFTTTGETSVSGFSKARERLDQAIEKTTGAKIESWTLHDLRRTFASGCARLGFPPQVVEAVLNHKSGTIRGVAAVYNRYDYAAEKRAALDAWGRHVDALISEKPRNVVEIRAAS